jgi:hypothetical protein
MAKYLFFLKNGKEIEFIGKEVPYFNTKFTQFESLDNKFYRINFDEVAVYVVNDIE